MTTPAGFIIVMGGTLGSVLFIMFIITWLTDGLREALEILGWVVAILGGVIGLIAFWIWAAGALT